MKSGDDDDDNLRLLLLCVSLAGNQSDTELNWTQGSGKENTNVLTKQCKCDRPSFPSSNRNLCPQHRGGHRPYKPKELFRN
jgi:hypothetical protein